MTLTLALTQTQDLTLTPPRACLGHELLAADTHRNTPSCAGILHASGSLADGVLARQSPQSLRKALAAKSISAASVQHISGLLPVGNLVSSRVLICKEYSWCGLSGPAGCVDTVMECSAHSS